MCKWSAQSFPAPPARLQSPVLGCDCGAVFKRHPRAKSFEFLALNRLIFLPVSPFTPPVAVGCNNILVSK